MEVFKPIKVENYQFMESGLNQYGYGIAVTSLEKRIEKLEEGFRKIELKNRDKSGEIYNLMERIKELNEITLGSPEENRGQRRRLFLYEDSDFIDNGIKSNKRN